MTDPRANTHADLRDYENNQKDSVPEFYRLNHQHQTYDFALEKRSEYGKLNRLNLGVWEACKKLDELVDDSDPDTELSQIEHLLQTAEAARRDGRPDWFILTALIHDLGKVLCLFDEPQWAVVGDTFPLGYPFSDKIIYSEFFSENPDLQREEFQQPFGIYKEGIGLDKVVMSWGHDEYMYQISKKYLPKEAAYIIRYHSFYCAHSEGEYTELMNDEDKHMFQHVRDFQPYDLYSKTEDAPDIDELEPYYKELISRFFPEMISF
jgi:inositol oxygenase